VETVQTRGGWEQTTGGFEPWTGTRRERTPRAHETKLRAGTYAPRIWQRSSAGLRTDASAPRKTGLLDRLETRTCLESQGTDRCHNFAWNTRNGTPLRASSAAAQEPTVRLTLPTPIILSAIKKSHSKIPPGLILGGGEFFPRNGVAGRMSFSLRSTRTSPPQLGNQHSFGRALLALPGATGVDSKTGAAIQRPVAPGEA